MRVLLLAAALVFAGAIALPSAAAHDRCDHDTGTKHAPLRVRSCLQEALAWAEDPDPCRPPIVGGAC